MVHLAPCRQRLRQLTLGQDAAVLAQRQPGLHLHADGVVHLDPGGGQGLEQFRMCDDARAAPGKGFGNTLAYLNLPPAACEQVGREQPAQRAAHDDGLRPCR